MRSTKSGGAPANTETPPKSAATTTADQTVTAVPDYLAPHGVTVPHELRRQIAWVRQVDRAVDHYERVAGIQRPRPDFASLLRDLSPSGGD